MSANLFFKCNVSKSTDWSSRDHQSSKQLFNNESSSNHSSSDRSSIDLLIVNLSIVYPSINQPFLWSSIHPSIIHPSINHPLIHSSSIHQSSNLQAFKGILNHYFNLKREIIFKDYYRIVLSSQTSDTLLYSLVWWGNLQKVHIGDQWLGSAFGYTYDLMIAPILNKLSTYGINLHSGRLWTAWL